MKVSIKHSRVLALTIGFLIVALHINCLPRPERTFVEIAAVDFSADDGDYDINWPGPPRRAWTDADREYYTATVVLTNPAPCNLQLVFRVRWDRETVSDKDLGRFSVTVPMGSTKGTGQFWLVCTKEGRVKGNIDKDNSSASIYCDLASSTPRVSGCPSLYVEAGYSERYRHTCNCK